MNYRDRLEAHQLTALVNFDSAVDREDFACATVWGHWRSILNRRRFPIMLDVDGRITGYAVTKRNIGFTVNTHGWRIVDVPTPPPVREVYHGPTLREELIALGVVAALIIVAIAWGNLL